MAEPLRLGAKDAEDLAVLGACLQDALVLVGDIAWLAEERRFVLVANRFRWEAAAPSGKDFARVTAGICFEGVSAVKRRNLDPRKPEAIVSLLALRPLPDGIELVFAGDAAIRLEMPAIDVRLQDLSEPWPTPWRPHHGAAEGGASR